MIETIIETMGIEGALILTFLEYACFPIPSEIVLPMLGYQASKNGGYFWVLILSVVVSLIACLILYCMGYYGGSILLNKISNKWKKSKKGIEMCEKFLQKHTKFTLVVARMLPLSRTYISLASGALKCSFYPYLFCSMIGISIWNAILIGFGYFFFANIGALTATYEKYKILILLALSVSIILLLVKKYCSKKR